MLSETIEVTGSLALSAKKPMSTQSWQGSCAKTRLLMEKLGAAMPTHIFREHNKVSDKKEGL